MGWSVNTVGGGNGAFALKFDAVPRPRRLTDWNRFDTSATRYEKSPPSEGSGPITGPRCKTNVIYLFFFSLFISDRTAQRARREKRRSFRRVHARTGHTFGNTQMNRYQKSRYRPRAIDAHISRHARTRICLEFPSCTRRKPLVVRGTFVRRRKQRV